VVITPAAGFVSSTSAVIMGIVAGIVPYLAVAYLKKWLGYDDALDTFGVHGVGGTLGAILTGIFADANVNPAIKGLTDGLLVEQLKAVCVTILWSVAATVVIAYVVKAVIGLRPAAEVERQGLDINEHGEEGYVS
jgi:Amt family ammonium transporter